MPLTIACLHTGASNAALFDAPAAALPGGALRLTHQCRPEWLRTPDPALLDEVAALLRAMAEDADAVLLTCSTIGAAVERARATAAATRARELTSQGVDPQGARGRSLVAAAADLAENRLAVERSEAAFTEIGRIGANSTGWWAGIPRHRGQGFHGMMGTDSMGSWAPGCG